LGANFIASALLKMGSTSFFTTFAFFTICGTAKGNETTSNTDRCEASERQRVGTEKAAARKRNRARDLVLHRADVGADGAVEAQAVASCARIDLQQQPTRRAELHRRASPPRSRRPCAPPRLIERNGRFRHNENLLSHFCHPSNWIRKYASSNAILETLKLI